MRAPDPTSRDRDARPGRNDGEPPRWERLRLVRHERSSFDGRFYERGAELWPIARAASTFADRDDWPEPAEYGAAFAGEGPVRFELAPARRRRPPGQPIVRASLYDAMIVGRRIVPTRARMWHDFLNALVWATFPRSKLALHTRQHRAIERWIPEGATQLPNARTRELDALALVDEGGVLVLDFGEREIQVLFGHALFEGLVFGQPAMISRGVALTGTAEGADAELAAMLDDAARFLRPDELPRRT
ncbi:MAG: DUF3025 domain-containing protein [Labilithrix sp.]|nr:DUF3025 domain-containing protein [Labilithrix sp.]